jgi:osmotically-inducible protein OsmY
MIAAGAAVGGARADEGRGCMMEVTMPRRHDHDHERPRDDRRRGHDDPYDRDEDADSYGQYGGLDRGLGYGGGRDLAGTGRFGRGRDPESYPRGGRYTDDGWQEARPDQGGRDDRSERQGRSQMRRSGRGWTDRAADEVASWFGDADASRRREADHRGKGPRGYRRSDARIQEDVSDRLTDDPDVDASDITVTVKEGEVTLDGHVDTRFAKRRAEDGAEDVSGVTHVQNNLRVRPAPVSPAPQSGGGTA